MTDSLIALVAVSGSRSRNVVGGDAGAGLRPRSGLIRHQIDVDGVVAGVTPGQDKVVDHLCIGCTADRHLQIDIEIVGAVSAIQYDRIVVNLDGIFARARGVQRHPG